MSIKLFFTTCTFCGRFIVLLDPIFTPCYVHTLQKFFLVPVNSEFGCTSFYSGTLTTLVQREAWKPIGTYVLPLLDPCKSHENKLCSACFRMRLCASKSRGPSFKHSPPSSPQRTWWLTEDVRCESKPSLYQQNHSTNLWIHNY